MFTSRFYRGLPLLAALVAVTVGGVACTKAPAPSRPSGSVSITVSDTSSSASSSAAPTSTPASSSTAPTTPPPSTSSAPSGPAGCTTSQLTVAVQRLSGAAGHQYANLMFTNKSSKVCTIDGFPGVVLLKGGAQLGSPAARSSMRAVSIALKPGSQVTALLTDASTCNADLSDSVQVIVPNQTQKSVLPLSLRGCPLTIDPVLAG